MARRARFTRSLWMSILVIAILSFFMPPFAFATVPPRSALNLRASISPGHTKAPCERLERSGEASDWDVTPTKAPRERSGAHVEILSASGPLPRPGFLLVAPPFIAASPGQRLVGSHSARGPPPT